MRTPGGKQAVVVAVLPALWVALLALALAAPALSAGFWEPLELRVMDDLVDQASGTPIGNSLRRFSVEVASAKRGVDARLAARARATAGSAGANAPAKPWPAAAGPGRTLTRELVAPSRELAALADQPPVADATPRAPTQRSGVGNIARQTRLPLVWLGVIAALLTYVLGCLVASRGAAVLASLILLATPLWALQTRQLASELGSVIGGLLLLCGVVVALRARATRPCASAIAGLAVAALGAWCCLLAGGALLGVLPPLIAGLAYASVVAVTTDPARRRARVATALLGVALLATVAITSMQTHDARPPTPGTRQWLGISFVPSGEMSSWLGGVWSTQPQPQMHAAAAFEHVAFGMWPWSGIALVALLALGVGAWRRDGSTSASLHARDPDAAAASTRLGAASAMLVAWTGAAWIAMALWQLNVGGVVVFTGGAAMALACAMWWHDRAHAAASHGAIAAVLIATAIAALAKDAAVSHDAFANLAAAAQLTGKAAQAGYQLPPQGPLGVAYATWLIGFGLLAAIATLPRLLATGTRLRRLASSAWLSVAALVVALGYNWLVYPAMDGQLSSEALFAAARDERGNDEAEGLYVLGELGRAPRYYDDRAWIKLASVSELLPRLQAPAHALAIAGRKRDLCAIHRGMRSSAYYVLDNGNAQHVLISNRPARDGVDHNPLAAVMRRSEPTGIAVRPTSPIIFDNKLELIGWTLPASIARGKPFEVTLYFRVLAAVGGTWKVFGHYDGPSKTRFGSDHAPIGELCATSTWEAGDYIIDTYRVTSNHGSLPTGPYQLWVGFFTGSNPNFRNMPVSSAPPGWADAQQRVRIATLPLR